MAAILGLPARQGWKCPLALFAKKRTSNVIDPTLTASFLDALRQTVPHRLLFRNLTCTARLQRILPDATLVGGTASAIHAQHRFSRDTDHVLTDLRIAAIKRMRN